MSAETKQEQIFLASLQDKLRQCEDNMYPTNSSFLDAHQQKLAQNFLRQKTADYCFWGGYAEAERRIIIFLPDYLNTEQAHNDYAAADPDGNPLAVLRVRPTVRQTRLTHRDYLGALMALGINRAKLGDLLVSPEGADIVILREMADYLLLNYTQVGRHSIEAEIMPTTVLANIQAPFDELQINVPSLRLDSVAAGIFGISRSKCSDAIAAGLLAVNSLQTTKPDYLLSEGDSITWRGKGKAIFQNISGTSKKDRLFLQIKRYI
ncbi:MAG: hypothetical protein IJE29_07260 [Firmicutes bacterium]|nr:hypothetical protein [Bacillota bacterium]